MNKTLRTVRCPICRKETEWTPEARWRPFCSERCRMIDLGQWASEGWKIEGETSPAPDSPHEETD